MLVGKNKLRTKKVGNILLGKQAFEYFNPDVVHMLNKYIEVVLMPDLFASELSEDTLRQRVKECMFRCARGPHALVLVVDPSDFKEQQRRRMEQVMGFFSEKACKHAMVFIYKEEQTQAKENKEIEMIIRSCEGTHHSYTKNQTEALQAIEEMVSKNGYSPLTYEGVEDAKEVFEMEQISSSSSSILVSLAALSSEKLTLVLCGSDTSLKTLVADMILSQEEQTGQSQHSGVRVRDSSACVNREGCVCGHHVTLIQLPSLESCQASEEDMWKETLECLHRCDPGVDAFLLIIPEGQRTDEDKSAWKRLKHFFGEGVGAFCLTVVTRLSERLSETRHGDTVAQQGRGISEGPNFIMDHVSKVKPLLERVLKMREDNRGWYSHDMCSASQLKSHLRCHSLLEERVSSLERENRTLKSSKQDLCENEKNVRIVLLGKTGEGKSATGNTILGNEVFKEGSAFQSVTTVCQKETVLINGRPITVIDTPGLFDTETDNTETKKEIVKCIGMASPGPHVFLLVKQLGRFTKEERQAVKEIQDIFGDQSNMYTIVLFTHGDKLKGMPLDPQNVGREVYSLLAACGMRYHVIENNNKNNRVQVNELLSKIDRLVEVNGGKWYTNEMFEEVEEALKQEQERILLERKETIEREKQELQAKHKAEMEKLKKEMEEEKRRQEDGAKRREEEFRSKENSMREAMKEAMEKMEEEGRRKTKAMDEEYQRKRQENEEWLKERTKEIHSEREQWERKTREEQRRRGVEEQKRKIEEIEEKRKRQKSQEEEREQHNKLVQNMLVTFEEEKMRKRQEYEERAIKEREKQKELEEKIKHAEESKIKELEEQKRKHLEECQRNQEKEENRLEEEKRKWKETHESKQREWQHKQEEEQKRYEKEKLEEKQKRDAEEKQRKIQEEQERQKMEQDTQTKMKETEDRIAELQKEYEQRQQEQEQTNREREEKRRAEKEEELRLQKKQFEEQMEKESKAREEEKKRNIEFLTKTHEKEKDLLKREAVLAARKQAEEEFNKELDKKVEEAKTQGYTKGHKEGKEAGKVEGLKEGDEKFFQEGHEKGYQEGHKGGMEKVEAERTRLGRGIDNLYKKLSSKSKKGGVTEEDTQRLID